MTERRKSYQYESRDGIDRVTWDRFYRLARSLSEQLARRNVDVIIGVARAGLFPATAVACALRVEFYPVRLSRRDGDIVRYATPRWTVPPPDIPASKCVAVVDDMADSGETLQIACERVKASGAEEVVSVSLFAHTWANPMPDVVGDTTDALVAFPWDAEVLVDGAWTVHPELKRFL